MAKRTGSNTRSARALKADDAAALRREVEALRRRVEELERRPPVVIRDPYPVPAEPYAPHPYRKVEPYCGPYSKPHVWFLNGGTHAE